MRLKYILGLMVIIFMVSCRTKKMPKSSTLSAVEVIQVIKERQLDYKDWSAKGSVSYDSPDTGISGSFTARIKKDSAIVIGFRKLGIEWARVFMDNEKYTIVNKWERTTETKSLSEAAQLISFDAQYRDIENLLCGNVILPDPATSTIELRNDSYILQFAEDGYDFEYVLNKENLLLNQSTVRQKGKILAIMVWGNYQSINNKGWLLPYYRSLQIPSDSEGNTSVEIKISSIDIDDNGELNFSIPADYERL